MIEPATAEQTIKEKAVFNEAWRILKQYYNASTDKDWENLVRETDKLCKMPTNSSKDKKLAESLAMAILEHIKQLSEDKNNQQ